MKSLVLAGLRFYMRYISPLFGGCCRFYPSCSVYAYQAIDKYGLVKGSLLALRRLLCCHPWHPGGYDPLPRHNSSRE